MKKLIVLSGNSHRNQAWGESAADFFGGWFDEVYIQYYEHWKSDSNEMDVDAELEKLLVATKSNTDEYIVFAKSMGSLLALLAVHRGYFKPHKCVFFGMPLELASEGLFKKDWTPLSTFSVPAIAFHNDEDPISYNYTRDTLSDRGPENIRLITKIGNNHNYTEFDEYEEEIKTFLA